MIGLRSLRNRLAVVFGLIVAGAIGTVYLSVTPRLEDSLRAQKLHDLQEDAKRSSEGLAREMRTANVDGEELARRVTRAASTAGAEVLVLGRVRGNPSGVQLADDSTPNGGVRYEDVNAIGLKVLSSGRPATATEPTAVGSQALAAQPLLRGKDVVGVAVFSDALDDVEADVALIRRQILISGGAALVIALLAGYLVA